MKKKSISGESRPLELSVQRVPFTASIDSKMRQLRGRTGVTPNILARYGFCLSLEEPGVPPPPFSTEKAGREINRNTLLGDQEAVYVALLRAWATQSGACADNDSFNEMFVRHMNRGFELLSARMRNLPDLANLIARHSVAKT